MQHLMMQNVRAKLFGEDIYLKYMDYSSAVIEIDRDKQLLVMYDIPTGTFSDPESQIMGREGLILCLAAC